MAVITIISAIFGAAAAIVPAALAYDAQAQALDAAAEVASASPGLESTGPAWTPSPMGQYAAEGSSFAGPPSGGAVDYDKWIAPAIGAAGIAALYFMVK
jgi:hypothetical protein